eukprot:SAG31_NODE_26463_length_441_cov_4.754386_2_plen_75_part_01
MGARVRMRFPLLVFADDSHTLTITAVWPALWMSSSEPITVESSYPFFYFCDPTSLEKVLKMPPKGFVVQAKCARS